MSMMECGHCSRAQDARSMQGCEGCGRMVCNECAGSAEYCPGDDEYDDR